MELTTISFKLNGREVTHEVARDRSLLDMLREDFDIVSPKVGCAPQAQCGCCTVLVDGKPRLSCALKAVKVDGSSVLTLEGYPPEKRAQLAEAFVKAGSVQCGYCTPGIAVRADALVEKNPEPSREEIARELRPHLCRCTGYVKLIDAIEDYAGLRRGECCEQEEETGKLGTSLSRYQGAERVLGDQRFVGDMKLLGMLHGACVFSEHPRAVVRKIDYSKAECAEGVKRVVTAADVPGNRIVGMIIADWPMLVAVGETTRCVGDMLAVVVADTEAHARAGAALVEVDYEVLEPVCSPAEALADGAPKLHDRGNLLSVTKVVQGDVDAALAASTHVVSHRFNTQRIEHMFLETEACLAKPTGKGLHVWSAGQGIFEDRRQIAGVMGWDVDRIDVELVPNGGAFGGKEDLSVQSQTALAAHLCKAPVRIVLNRRESFRLHPKRHPMEIDFAVGCDGEGRLTAVRCRIVGDTGAYASAGPAVVDRAGTHAAGPYKVANVDLEAKAVYTNNLPCGAMRGFGVNQSAFGMETCLDMLAEKVGIDRWEMRWRNILRKGDRFATGQKMEKPFGLEKTLLAVKDAFLTAQYAGIACGIKNVGIGNGLADLGKSVLKVEEDGHVSIYTGFTEMGQGLFTACIQFACQVTGLPPETFSVLNNSSYDLGTGQTTASRGTVLAGNAVVNAAEKLKVDLDAGHSLKDLAGREYRGDYCCDFTTAPDANVADPVTHLTYSFGTQVVILNDQGIVSKVIAAHDIGRVVNRKALEGQFEGSIHMGLGYALTEDFPVEGGRVVARNVNACGVLRAEHMPEVEVILIEEPDRDGPFGARGAGEVGLVPIAAAVAGALHAYDGKRRFRLPMRDSAASQAIKPMRNEGSGS